MDLGPPANAQPKMDVGPYAAPARPQSIFRQIFFRKETKHIRTVGARTARRPARVFAHGLCTPET
jgi:hypothetical protein